MVICALCGLCSAGAAVTVENVFSLHFVDSVEAGRLLAVHDKYIDSWGRFDIEARAGQEGATRDDFLERIKSCTRNFSEADKDSLVKAFSFIDERLSAANMLLPLPEEFVLVKTTMEEEGGAGAYTRGDIICIGEYVLRKANVRQLATLVAHEVFHVLTRDNPEFRKAMYSVIGFNVLDNEISFAQDVIDRRISNPDVNRYDSYAWLTVDGKKDRYTMVIYSDRDYSGGSFFNYIKIGLIPLDDSFNPVVRDGKTVIVPLDKASDFYDKVGRNTGYVINPEECLADNFSIAVCGTDKELPDPKITERIISLLRSSKFSK